MSDLSSSIEAAGAALLLTLKQQTAAIAGTSQLAQDQLALYWAEVEPDVLQAVALAADGNADRAAEITEALAAGAAGRLLRVGTAVEQTAAASFQTIVSAGIRTAVAVITAAVLAV